MAEKRERTWKRAVTGWWVFVTAAALFGYWLIVSTLF
jgi:hypothetical protein